MSLEVPLSAECWYLTGPTASGKTAVGIALAELLGAEIISMDSMALYKGMDIGTAKPTPDQRARVPHHLVDILQPHQDFSLAQYLSAAARAADDIRSRGKQVLFVGGTPLYLKGLLRGIFQGPPADWEFRQRLQAEAARQPPGWLHQQLESVDPQAAARLHPNDARRLIRALEVFVKTGRPISQWQQQFDKGAPASQRRVFVLAWPRQELYRRIDQRVEQMFAAGLVEEVQRLLRQAAPQNALQHAESSAAAAKRNVGAPGASVRELHPQVFSRTALQAVGYREVIEYLQQRRDLPETIALVKQRTRQLAKRQVTWFRSLSECRFVPVSGQLEAQCLAQAILSAGRQGE